MTDKSRPSSRAAFNSITNQDGTPARTKDNVQPEPKPPENRHSRPNLAPQGMMGLRANLPSKATPQPATQRLFQGFNKAAGKDHDIDR